MIFLWSTVWTYVFTLCVCTNCYEVWFYLWKYRWSWGREVLCYYIMCKSSLVLLNTSGISLKEYQEEIILHQIHYFSLCVCCAGSLNSLYKEIFFYGFFDLLQKISKSSKYLQFSCCDCRQNCNYLLVIIYLNDFRRKDKIKLLNWLENEVIVVII